MLLIGGCSNTAAPTGQPSGGTGTSGATSTSSPVTTTGTGPATASTPPTGSGSGTTTTLRDADKGKTITVKVGDPVTLTLTGTNWAFTDPKPPSVLTAMSPPIRNPEPGNSSISFRAAKAGTATVTATQATGATFQITVIVQ
jgi:hypothetical protein